MRAIAVMALVACGSSSPPPGKVTRVEPAAPLAAPAALPVKVTLTENTPGTTAAGHTFVVPAGWSMSKAGPVTRLEPPEGGSFIAIVDVVAASDKEAVDRAWALVDPSFRRELRDIGTGVDLDGWTQRRGYNYRTAPDERREVSADTFFSNGTWLVVIYDMASAVAEKRRSQEGVIFSNLLPKGFTRETFVGKRAHELDAGRVATLERWIEDARVKLDVPGVAVGIVQRGKVVMARGFGVRELGKPAAVDTRTKFGILSVTKPLTTLMLAKLVDEGKLTWETAVTEVMPDFALGDASTTSQVRIKHLICACTGMPRRDKEWAYEYGSMTPARVVEMLRTMQPTSKFGELFQYSNLLAATAGFVGGVVAYPKRELGAAYDDAMRTRVFEPLGMSSSMFDLRRAQAGNFARGHGHDHTGAMRLIAKERHAALTPVRPTGGAWSTVEDLLRYVQMELALGKRADGSTYIQRAPLLARRTPQVMAGDAATYGMGLVTERRGGLEIVSHSGDGLGYHSIVLWLPEHDVGAVLLTNGSAAPPLRDNFSRKLVELLFDAKAEADAALAARIKRMAEGLASMREKLAVPADAAAAAKLARAYVHPALGEITVRRAGTKVIFDVGEWQSEVGTWVHVDGTIAFVAIEAGASLAVVPGVKDGKRTLVLRDMQHEYIFVEK